ncbi:MAG: glycosyltransferase family 2 protein [Chloroflexota bacterium]|nr:glycosyltransferase family 2 protein [Chloroflexota bacterium]
MTQPYLSVVIPAYNEESRIEATLEQVHSYLSHQTFSWEVVVADDGSTDGTARLVSGFCRDRAGVRLLTLVHRGKGWAVQQGMLAAAGKYRFLCDADLSMPIEQIDRFLSPEAQGADIVVGSRELAGSRRIGEPGRRHLMGRGFNWMIRALALPGIRDTQCGFKCFRAETTVPLFERQTLWGFAFDVEILYMARKADLEVREVAIDWHYREGSKVRPLRDALAMARDVLKIRWSSRGESGN